MTVRRVASILVCLVATVSVSAAVAQPKKGAPAPAKDPVPATTGSGSAGSAEAAPAEEAPPVDMDGKDENPDGPRGITAETKVEVVVPVKQVQTGYPIEEVLRPITLPANMAEVAIGPHAQFDAKDVDFAGSDALRARYGITRNIQLGLTYVLGGIYDDPKTAADKVGFHPGKALGLDVTVLLRDWVGVKVGVPVWIYRPERGGAPAIGLTLGAPMKFKLTEKFALGGLDDLLAIKLTKFAPTFEYEYQNAGRAQQDDINTPASRGFFRVSAYGIYQRSPRFALIGRFGITLEDFTATATQSDRGGGSVTHLRGGFEYTLRKSIDLGFSLGFADLSELGSFGPAGLLAFRI